MGNFKIIPLMDGRRFRVLDYSPKNKSPRAFRVIIPVDNWDDLLEIDYSDDGHPINFYLKQEVYDWCMEIGHEPMIERLEAYDYVSLSMQYGIAVNFKNQNAAIHFKLRWIG